MHAPQDIDREDKDGPLSVELIAASTMIWRTTWAKIPRTSLSGLDPTVSPEDVLTLDAAVTELRIENPRQADIIDRRFYLGMTADEVAAALALSKTTIEREERNAKKFLRNKMSPGAA